MSDAILLAGEDRWTVEKHNVGVSTRYSYESKGIPAREVANDLVDWYQGKQKSGKGKRGTSPAIDLGSVHLLIPEVVLSNPKYQALWRCLAIIWRNRDKDPDLFDAIEKLLAHGAREMGGQTPPIEQEKKA